MKKIIKKNNKGFSLVELIVVVLIMAIIAVSLAPQVMKWVDRSRQANDASNYNALKSAAQLSVLAAPGIDVTISMGSTTTTNIPTDVATQTDEQKKFLAALESNLPSWDDIKVTSTSVTGPFTIVITDGVIMSTSDAPDEISAN